MAERNIEVLKKVGEYFGLKVNVDKSKALVYKCKERPVEIGGIEVVKSLKCLGMVVDDSRDLYSTHRKAVVGRSKWRARDTCSAIERSYNRGLVGKTIWKDIELPGLLFGAGLLNFTKRQVNALQRMDNMVYRTILRAPSYVAVKTLRGEIGSSCMSSRLTKGMLLLAKSMMESENGLVREILGRVRRDDKNAWNRGLKGCLEKVGLEYDSLGEMSKGQLKEKVIEMDTMEWKRDMERKSSLYFYRIYKESERIGNIQE